ncbi:class I SAM-dependent methyltransferase [bacterium]|nr:class I SAM-dependent methyltransferase [bacterium]
MAYEILETLSTIQGSNNYNLWIYNSIKHYLHGNIIDIGSGIGNIARYYNTSNIDKVILSDREEEMYIELKNKFSYSEKYAILKMDITDESCIEILSAYRVDVATCINALEHIKDDVKALVNMHKILNKNGILLLIVPAFPFLYGTLDIISGHIRRYTKKTLNEKLKQAHYTIKKQHYMNFFGIATWFLAGRILKQKELHKNVCRVLDRFVPVLEMVERYRKPSIGQSIVTVCSKS